MILVQKTVLKNFLDDGFNEISFVKCTPCYFINNIYKEDCFYYCSCHDIINFDIFGPILVL